MTGNALGDTEMKSRLPAFDPKLLGGIAGDASIYELSHAMAPSCRYITSIFLIRWRCIEGMAIRIPRRDRMARASPTRSS